MALKGMQMEATRMQCKENGGALCCTRRQMEESLTCRRENGGLWMGVAKVNGVNLRRPNGSLCIVPHGK